MATTTQTKINDLARVLSMRQTDWPTPADITVLELLGTGQRVEWRASTDDAYWAQDAAPFQVGSVLALEAFAKPSGALSRVRYACNNHTFRGATWHRTHAA